MRPSRIAVLAVVCAVGACTKKDEPRPAEVLRKFERAQPRAAPKAAVSPPETSAANPAAAPRRAPTLARADQGQQRSGQSSEALQRAVEALGPPREPLQGAPTVSSALSGHSSGASPGHAAGDVQGLGGLGTRGQGSGGGGLGVGTAFGSRGGRSASPSLGGSVYGAAKGGEGRMGKVVSGSVVVSGYGAPQREPAGTEDYGTPRVNAWTLTETDHLSTFAVDVDTASYTLGRRKLLAGELPPKDSVRVEEWLNYFRYAYPQPPEGAPLAVQLDAAPSPFTPGKHLLRVGVQARRLDISERKPTHLTFLVDVSGSMSGPDRLPLAKRALRMLVDQLREDDTVALVTYAGSVRLVLPHTGMEKKAQVHAAIEDLTAGGSTAMGSGLELAYQQALTRLDSKSVSRVLILSDGDANVGATSQDALLKLIAGHVKEGVTLTSVGLGMGNYKAALLEQLADRGNGNAYYVDSLMAARRIFVEQLGGTLEVIAQDVKLQVDFNPAQVNAYRLIGYENRDVADADFRNDKVDAGELGSGHTVTALYEVDLKPGAGEGLVTVRVRAKKPRGVEATERRFEFKRAALAETFAQAPADLRFATAVMASAEIFRRSPHAAEWSLDEVHRIARGATPEGNAEREEFLSLLERAKGIVGRVAGR